MMEKSQSIRWYSVIWQLFHLGGGGLLLILFWGILGRYWSVSEFGQFSYIIAYISIAGIFFDYGLDVLLTRHIAAHFGKIPKAYWQLKAIVSLLFFAIFLVLGFFLKLDIIALSYLLIGSIALSLSAFFNAVLRAHDKLDIEAKIGIIQKLIFIFGSIYGVIVLQQHIIWVAQAFALSHIISLGLSYLSVHYLKLEQIGAKDKTIDKLKSVFKQSTPLFLVALLSILGLRVDIFILQALLGDEAVAYFTASMRLVEGCIVFGTAYQAAIFPKIVAQIEQHSALRDLVFSGIKHLLLGAGFITIVGIIIAPYLVSILYGEKYEQSILILISLLPSILLVFQTNLLGSILVAQHKQGLFLICLSIALVINIFINILAIMQWGIIGAVIGFWAKEMVLMGLLVFYLYPSLQKR